MRRGEGGATLAAYRGGGSVSVTSPHYEIRVKGRLSASLVASFDGLSATVEPVETVLAGTVEDQAALHSLLQRVQALGLELMEVRRIVANGE
jgi:hypothetical protein